MRVVYILNGTALYGGVKVVYQQVRALRRLGVAAEVVSPDPPSSWFPGVEEFYRRVEPLRAERIGAAEVAVGTIWFTVPLATELPGAVPFHLCQCFEPLYEGVREELPEIEAAYRLPTRKLAVSPHLATLIRERFGEPATWIPQPFEPHLFRPPEGERATQGRLRVLVSGQWELPIKGVERALRGMRPLFEEGWIELVRLSQDAPAAEVAAWPEAERHVSIPPAEVPDLLRGVDLYVGLSTADEGFGLPALEAMGCARPCILSDIPAARALDPASEASILVPGDGEAALRAAIRRLRDDPELRRRLGRGGRRIAEQFTEERSARALVAAFEAALER